MLGNATALGTGGLTMSGGTLDLNANSITVASLSGTGGTITDNNATAGISTLTVNQTTTTSFAGTLVDGSTRNLAFALSGGGRLTLSSNNSYSGGTTIDGLLVAGGNSALGTGAIVIDAGTGHQLQLARAGVTVSDGLTISSRGGVAGQSRSACCGPWAARPSAAESRLTAQFRRAEISDRQRERLRSPARSILPCR